VIRQRCHALVRVSAGKGQEVGVRDQRRLLGVVLGMIGKLCPPEDRHLRSRYQYRGNRHWGSCNCTNIKNQTLCRGFYTLWPFHFELAHAGDNGTDKVDIKYREYIYQVEGERNGQKAKAVNSSHGDCCRLFVSRNISASSRSD